MCCVAVTCVQCLPLGSCMAVDLSSVSAGGSKPVGLLGCAAGEVVSWLALVLVCGQFSAS